MTSSVISVKAFDIAKLSFGEIKKLDNNGKYIPMYYDKNPFVLQTPQCYAPYGLNTYKDDTAESHSLELSFKNKEEREILQKFFAILEDIDKKILDGAVQNSQSWFRKTANREVIEALFTPTIKYPKDKETGEIITKYPPTFRMKLKKDTKGEFNCTVYDHESKEESTMDDMIPKMKGSKITAITNCSGIWVAGSKFGISWKATQLLVSPQSGLKKFAFQEIPGDSIDNEDDKTEDKVKDDDDVVAQVSSCNIESSDDDEDVDDDSDDAEETNVPVKKVVKRKPAAKKSP